MSRVADDTQSVATSQMSINFGKLFQDDTCSHTSLTGFLQTLPRSTRAAFFPGRAASPDSI